MIRFLPITLVVAGCDLDKEPDTGDVVIDERWECQGYYGTCPGMTIEDVEPGALLTAWQCLDGDCVQTSALIWSDDGGSAVEVYCVDVNGYTGEAYSGAWTDLIVAVCVPPEDGDADFRALFD